MTNKDCISQEAVIEWLKDKDIIKTKNQEENARKELTFLSSAMQKTRWIPVSERLPEFGEDVLATDDVDMFVAFIIGDEWHSSDENYDKDTPIVAWMPLPEPYKAESEEE